MSRDWQEESQAGIEVPTTLYRVRYGDAAVRETEERLKQPLKEIQQEQEKLHLEPDKRELVNRMVRSIVGDILHLYKHVQYEKEEEARIAAAFDISFKRLRMDVRRSNRLYVETEDSFVFFRQPGSQVIIGPRVPNIESVELSIRYRLERNGFGGTTEVLRSGVQYR